jgi:hypothetical protein
MMNVILRKACAESKRDFETTVSAPQTQSTKDRKRKQDQLSHTSHAFVKINSQHLRPSPAKVQCLQQVSTVHMLIKFACSPVSTSTPLTHTHTHTTNNQTGRQIPKSTLEYLTRQVKCKANQLALTERERRLIHYP